MGSNQPNYQGVTSIKYLDAMAQDVAPGIKKRELWTGEGGACAYVLEFAEGAVFPGLDEHTDNYEQIFVLSGTFSDGKDDHATGSFIHYPIGSSHIPQSKTGCTVLVLTARY